MFGLLRFYMKRNIEKLYKEGVRVRLFGSRDRVPEDILDLMDRAAEKTKDNSRLFFNIAFNYGGRAEIVEAARLVAEDVRSGILAPNQIDEEVLQSRMWTAELPDADLLLRTSGEERISNFLLWNIAYSELLFTDVLWPDFDRSHVEQALDAFKRRDRRFGGVA